MKSLKRYGLFVVLLTLVIGATRPAFASDAQAPGPWAQALARDRRDARIWYFGWSGAYLVSLGVRVSLAVAGSDEGLRVDSRVAAVTSGIGLVATLLQPPLGIFDRDPATPREGVLAATAEDQRAARGWLPHLSGIAVNLCAGAFLWLHEERPVSGALSAGIGIAVTELKIFTRPRRILDLHTGQVQAVVIPTGSGIVIQGTF